MDVRRGSALRSVAVVEPTITAAPESPLERSSADRFMRRLLRLPPDAPRESILGTENVFGKSIAISGIRCLLTYVLLPLLAPIVNLSGAAGPVLGLALGLVSTVAIVISMRRFFAADHRYRWAYAAVGGAILIALAVAAVVDLSNLFG